MSLRITEEKLMREIEQLGLHRIIKHFFLNDSPITLVELFDKIEWLATKGNPIQPEPVAMDIYCVHPNEQFYRRKGRVIATGRALKKVRK